MIIILDIIIGLSPKEPGQRRVSFRYGPHGEIEIFDDPNGRFLLYDDLKELENPLHGQFTAAYDPFTETYAFSRELLEERAKTLAKKHKKRQRVKNALLYFALIALLSLSGVLYFTKMLDNLLWVIVAGAVSLFGAHMAFDIQDKLDKE